MQVVVFPTQVSGKIGAPASKSSMQRACAAALLTPGTSIIRNPGHSNDDLAAIRVIESLGAGVVKTAEAYLKIEGRLKNNQASAMNCGESGLGIRMFAPIAAMNNSRITISGEGSLLSRPMDFFDEVFPQLGISISSNKGKLPITLTGPLKPHDISIDGSLSSQFLTGLLMAYSASGASGVSIRVNNLKSRPYIDLTLTVMKQFGMKVPDNRNYEEFYFDNNPISGQRANVVDYSVEGDWSGGAFLLVAGALAGNIRITGLDPASTQADKSILEAIGKTGARLEIDREGIDIGPAAGNADLIPFEMDSTDCPDLFPPLAALAAYCKGCTRIKGVKRLTHKESNRALTLQQEFGKMGLQIDLEDDWMLLHGGMPLNSSEVHSRHDHRIAMACAVAALRAKGPVTISEADAISKSYPDFYEDLKSIGTRIDSKQEALSV